MQVILYNLGYLFSHALITYYLDHIEKRMEKLKELLSCQTKILLCQINIYIHLCPHTLFVIIGFALNFFLYALKS